MSQAGSIDTGSSPSVPTSFVTDVNSPAVPAANVLNVLGGTTFINDDDGILTDGSSGSNTLTVFLTNRISNTVTTTDATPTNLSVNGLGASANVYNFEVNVAAYNTTDATGAGFSVFGTIRTDGAAATLINTSDVIKNTEGTMSGTDVSLSVSGNNVLIIVTGLAAKTINWKGITTYTVVGA